MTAFFEKLRGGSAQPPRARMIDIALAWLGGLLAIGAVSLLASLTHATLILGSFGASCVLIFGFPDSPFSQPRNVIAGHVLSSLVGLVCLSLFGAVWWSMALAVATAIALMLATRTVHPPAGSNPVIVMLSQPGWSFLITPTLVGSILLVLIAVGFNNLPDQRRYPKYWF